MTRHYSSPQYQLCVIKQCGADKEKNPRNPNLSIIHAADTIRIAYPRRVLRSVKILAQKSFRSFRISCFHGRSDFPVVSVFPRSFRSLHCLLFCCYRFHTAVVPYLLGPASLLLQRFCRFWWSCFRYCPCSCCSIKSSNILDNRAQRGLQWDVVYLGWPVAPSCMSPNAGGGESCGVSAMRVQLYTRAQINFGDLTPYLTYDRACDFPAIMSGDCRTVAMLGLSIIRTR